ncbi:hypothetical protein H4R99_006180 [Coemansia sp. RSA 1722]|nr:hypothetical protein IWW45_006576 [Coemansia sp. RSA 485]KAJ2593148.1 hypothetical protein H4R99_006180 [Coemansia sp. RSA 1722]
MLAFFRAAQALGMSRKRRLELRDQTKAAFYHAFNGYMEYAFPFDELNPITCSGRGRDRVDPKNIGINDVLGDYLLTLVDTLDTLAVLGDKAAFAKAVADTIKFLPNFDIDSHVQVFEVTIRMLGGLLSAHIIATDEVDTLGMRLGQNGTAYNGELLRLARDLGYRLLPAFEASPNGVPYPRTNLKHGFDPSETSKTCTAGVGTLLLEFGTLSRLTNETIFEDIAIHALNEMWLERSKNNLFGDGYDLEKQQWITRVASIGAGVDSIYEYLLKGHIYFGGQKYLRAFETLYSALLQHVRDTTGGYAFFNVDMQSLEVTSTWIDSLSAFFPGLMVLAGDVDGAESAYMLYYHLWRRFRAMPERFNLFLREADLAFYPLRPEFIESTYFLYRATRDPFYLDVGEMVLEDINALFRTACGYASVHSVNSHELEERMESFLLSETFKYLYMLFDEENPLHRTHSNFVFTTEGHVLLPLSPLHTSDGNRSAQYPPESTFDSRKLIHSERPPSKMNPHLYHIDNIQRKLQSVHPQDILASPAQPNLSVAPNKRSTLSKDFSFHSTRKCPVPRRPSINKIADSNSARKATTSAADQFDVGWSAGNTQSPLMQLFSMRELSRATNEIAGYSLAEHSNSEYLTALFVNGPFYTVPLRPDFYNIGLLVNNHFDQPDGSILSSDREKAGLSGMRNGTTVLASSLAIALEYDAMCSVSSKLHFLERHKNWQFWAQEQAGPHAEALGLLNPPKTAETWLAPNTRQVSFMEFVMSRAEGKDVDSCTVPWQPVARRGVPLLRDIIDNELPDMMDDERSEQACTSDSCERPLDPLPPGQRNDSAQPRRRGHDLADVSRQSEQQTLLQQRQYQQQLVITNGAAKTMSDYVLVRARAKAPMHKLESDSTTNNSTPGVNSAKLTWSRLFSRTESPEAFHSSHSDTASNKNSGSKDNGGSSHTRAAESDEHHRSNAHYLRPHDTERRREYVGTLAPFAERALYRSHLPLLVPNPTALVMLHLTGPSSIYGCEEYTPLEQMLVKDKAVAVRAGGGCTVREKAVHAMNAGSRALLVDSDSAASDCGRQQNPSWSAHQQPLVTAPMRDPHDIEQMCLSKQCAADSLSLQMQEEDSDASGQVSMPVVVVDHGTIGELEQYLTAGLFVQVELL